MIRKSGDRFSEKIMRKQKITLEHDSTQLNHALRVQKPNRLRSSDGTLSINPSISSFLPLCGAGELLEAAALAGAGLAGEDGFGTVDKGCGGGLSRLTSSVGAVTLAWVGAACQRLASDLA